MVPHGGSRERGSPIPVIDGKCCTPACAPAGRGEDKDDDEEEEEEVRVLQTGQPTLL